MRSIVRLPLLLLFFRFQIGPQFNDSLWDGVSREDGKEYAVESASESVQVFLDKALKQYGKHSLLYIRCRGRSNFIVLSEILLPLS